MKGIPLEEIAKLFGETDKVMVFSQDIRVDHNIHELDIGEHAQENIGEPAKARDKEEYGAVEEHA